jgi:hypothetical protein
VASFNVTGSGASDAADFQVGQQTFVLGDQEGGGIYQSFFATAGTLTLDADIAAFAPGGNVQAGVFSLLLDGQTLDTVAFGLIFSGVTDRGTLTATAPVSSGTHTLEILITRPFLNNGTPQEFVDNVTVDDTPLAAPVPEPTSLVLLGTGLIGAGVRRFRRRSH